MALPNIFTKEVSNKVIERTNILTPTTQANWGKMDVSQMLAHLSVMYEMVYEDKHKKPNAFMKFILKSFVKNTVVNEKPYKRNSQTAPAFIIKGERDFEAEKNRLIAYIIKTEELGEAGFDGKESNSFGKLNKTEWNNLFYKHIDHHLTQFGV
ncbi:DUF1569 domain-containing protein [Cellulophaga baltica]|uniref:DUF1569 domain-containing protein n=1 Tax=Cellulophaga TaxID=104264 RepID=UPI001C067C7D|nr:MULTISPECIES: DUF1569 domain-containing protein [Cellulophaga]MBU2996555.1 DUF1569 domain-containing protein [Cellulophaga baltica]MDO6767949.1 DUF1569 domain-containing protein [Cellulophaga sp. 1_MG-2023]